MFREHAASMQPPASTEAEQLIVRLLKRTMPFQVISEDMLQSVAAVSRPFSYRAGEVIYRAGDKADDVYVVVSGAVEHLLSDTPTTVERNRVMHSGDVYGWAAVLGQDKRVRLATATCVETAEVIRINGAALIERLNEDPATAGVVMSRFATMITREFGAPAAAAQIAAPGPVGAGCAGRSAAAAGPGDGTRADDVPDIALAAEPQAIPDAPRVRALPRLLVPVGRGVEAPAVSRDAGAHRGVPRVVQQEPHLWAVVLYTRVLRAHLGERASRRHRILSRDGARGSARAVPRVVEHIPRIRLSGIRDAAPDSGAGLGSRSRS